MDNHFFSAEIIDRAYQILATTTPLSFDCGRLCGSICCSSQAPGTGMILFPGEERRYPKTLPWAEIEKYRHIRVNSPELPPDVTDFDLYLLRCHGVCSREQRPLACRVFPLAPLITENGVIRLVLDTDGMEICPLVHQGQINRLRTGFVRQVRRAFQLLAEDPRIRFWMEMESTRRARQMQEPWHRLAEL